MLASAPAVRPNRRSYTFLVERLLPRHLLSGSQRARLDAALAQDDRDRLYGETVAALLELASRGLFEELPSPDPGTRVFRHRGTADLVRLEQPRSAAQQASRPNQATAETLADDAGEPQATPAGPGLEVPRGAASATDAGPPDAEAFLRDVAMEAWSDSHPEPATSSASAVRPDVATARGGRRAAARAESAPERADTPAETAPGTDAERSAGGPAGPEAAPAALVVPAAPAPAGEWLRLEPFIELAGIEPQLEPFGDRLRRIVAQLERALPGGQARLFVLESEGVEGLGDGAVQVLERATADEMPHYREALRRGETQFATSAPLGTDPASGRIAAAVPIYVGGEAWGLLQVTWPRGHTGSVAELARLLAPLARLVAMAIQNQTTLEKLVFVDPLTGVYNRAFYDRQVSLEIERANRTNQKFALLVVDVDDFKPVNDRFGHRAGDQVLAQLAREVRGRMRKIDLMFRYGGEEFVLLLPGADLEEAQRTAERLRLLVSEQRFLAEGLPTPLRVTVSIGGAVYPDQSRTKTGIFNAADTALYRAKHEGKNRVAF
jgi:diguanylate cyclase (GGDEF)-like protein